MTSGERPPVEARQPSLPALELAGSLQGVVLDVENRDFDLEFFQEEALYKVGTKLLDGETQGYVESATGSGKSLLIALIAEAAVAAGKRVHVMVPTVQIGDQIIGADGEEGMGLFTNLVKDKAVKANYGGKRANKKTPVVVSSYMGVLEEQKAIDRGEEGRLGEFDLVLGDECHMSLGTETVKALYRYMPDALKIGFSATPDYGEDRKSAEVWGSRWFEFSLLDLIDAERASPIRPLLMLTDSTIELTDYRKEFTERELAPLINDFERNGLAVQLAQDFVAEGRQGIIACVPGDGNSHAKILAELLSGMEANDRPIIAKDVGNHLPRREQRERLAAYNRGEIDVLTYTSLIGLGWNSKLASFCISLRESSSPVLTIQRLGRIARLKELFPDSVYVEFVDRITGAVRKDQYTAFHALGLDTVDSTRVLGWGDQGPNDPKKRSAKRVRDPSQYLRPELYERLMSVQGKVLRDVLVGRAKSAGDPLVNKWERTMAGEGMPAELPPNITFSPFLAKKYDRARASLLRENGGVEPTSDEIADFLTGITQEQTKMVREYGQQLVMDSEVTIDLSGGEGAAQMEIDLPNDEEDPVVEKVERRMLGEYLKRTINSLLNKELLTERDAGILRFRYGVDTSEPPRTIDELSNIFNISRERARQIEKKTLGKLRHPNNNELIRDYIGFAEEDADTAEPEKKKTYFPRLPEVTTADADDYESYRDYLLGLSQVRADQWLEDKHKDLDAFVKKLKDEWRLQDMAEHVAPLGYETKTGKFISADSPGINIEAWKVPKIYDANELRAHAMMQQRVEIDEELRELALIRRRVASRPSENDIHGSLETTKAVLDIRTHALLKYRDTLNRYTNQYLALTNDPEPEHITIRWG